MSAERTDGFAPYGKDCIENFSFLEYGRRVIGLKALISFSMKSVITVWKK